MILGQPSAPQHPPETSAHYLERIRENSNYHALRSIIGVVFWVLMLALWAYLAFMVFLMGSAPFTPGVRGGSGIAVVSIAMIVASGGIGTLLLVAGRQAAVVVIDIADTLQDAHRRK